MAVRFDLTCNYSSFSAGMEKAKASITELNNLIGLTGSGAGQSFARMSAEAEGAAHSTSALGRAFGDFFKQYTAASLALEGFSKFTRAIKNAGSTIIDFQAKNSMLGAILGESEESMKEMVEQAKELGRATVFTASQVTQLQIELSKLGFEKPAIQDMTQSILDFAQATGGDLGDAAALTGAAIRMFGAQTDEAARYTNAMARATTASALDFRAIRDNLATFGPMAHSIGLEIEDVLALFGTLKNAGIEGSTAMTSLRNIFTKVAQGKIPGMEGGVKTLDEFVAKLKQLEGIDPGKSMKMIGPRGGTQFMSLMQQADQILELRDKIKEASEADTTGGMAERMTQNVSGAIKRMESAWEGFVLAFSNTTGPWATVVDTLAKGINKVTDLISDGSTINVAAINGVMAAMGSLIAMYGVAHGVQAVNNALTAEQTAQYMRMAAALEAANRAEVVGYNTELQSAVAKGILTKQQAAQITALMGEADAQVARITALKGAIATEISAIQTDIKYIDTEMTKDASIDKTTLALYRQQLVEKEGILTTRLSTANTNLDAIAQQKDATMKMLNTGATMSLKTAMDALGLSMLANPYILVAAAIGGVVYAISSYKEGVLTAEEAQVALNKAEEEHNRIIKEEESAVRNDLKVIQDKNASLYDQYKAYTDLTRARAIFAQYSQEEIAAMTQSQFDAILSHDSMDKEQEMVENRVKALKEYKQWLEDEKIMNALGGTSWGKQEKLQELGRKYGIEAETKQWYESIGGWTENAQWVNSMLNEATKQMDARLSDAAYAGIVNGIKRGFSDSTIGTEGKALLDDFSEAIATAPEEEGRKIAEAYKEKVNPQLKETKDRIEELNRELINATGKKKTEIEAELKTSYETQEFLEGLMTFFDAGVNNKELTVNVKRETDNEVLGDEKLIEIGKGYEEAEKAAEKYLVAIDQMRERIGALGDDTWGVGQMTSEELTKVAEEFGLTSDDVQNDVGKTREALSQEIGQLRKDIANTKDEAKRDKLQIEIARKQELLDYITNLHTMLLNLVGGEYNIKIVAQAQAGLEGLTGKPMTSTFDLTGESLLAYNDNKYKSTNALKAEDEARRAAQRQATQKKADAEEAKATSEKAAKEAKKRAESAAKQRQKEFDIAQKEAEAQAKQRKATQNAISEAYIAQIDNDGARERAEQERKYNLSIQQVAELEEKLKKENLAAKKARWEAENKDTTKVWADTAEAKAGWEAVELNEQQQAQITATREKAEAEYMRILEQRQKAEIAVEDDFLKQYGTFQERKLAIAREYERKIREVEGSGMSESAKDAQVAAYRKEQARAESAIDAQRMRQQLDWAALFQGTAVIQGIGRQVLEEAGRYTRTEAFQTSDADDKKAIYEAMTALQEAISGEKGVFGASREFTEASHQVEAFASQLGEAKEMQQQYADAIEENTRIAETTTGLEREEALERIKLYREMYDGEEQAISDLTAKTQVAASTMASAAKNFHDKLNSVTSGISKLASGNGLSDMYSGLSDVIKGFGGNNGKDLTDATGALGKAGGYIGAAFSIADMINEQGLDKMVTNITSTASNAVVNIMKSMFSSDMWKSLLGGVVDGIMAPFDAIFGKQGNMEEMKKEMETLERSNEALENALNGLSEKLDNASFGDISQIGEDLEEYTEKLEGNTRKMMYNAAGRWERGSHSVAAKYAGLTREQDWMASIFGTESKSSLAQINNALGTSFVSLEDMLNNITTSQMSKLQGKYIDVWQTFVDDINEVANEHNGGELLVEKMTEFAGLDGRLDEVKEKIQTKLLGISFDGMKDSFLNTLKDMTKDGSEIMDDFNDIVYRSIAGRYDGDLKSLRERAADAAKAEQWDVLHELERQYKDIVAQARSEVDEAKRRGDIVDTEAYQQSATGRAFSSMSQESADELNGRFTAMQVGQEQILQQVIMGVAQMQTLTDAVVMRGVATSEIRNLVFNIDGNVDTIARQTKTMISSFGDKLERIANTLETKL